jgi:hypothetical protein
MGDLRDFAEFADPLRFPINGKVYTAEPSIEGGLQVIGILRGTDTSLNSQPGSILWKLALGGEWDADRQVVSGGAWDAMAADKVGFHAIARAGFAAMIDIELGRAAAIAAWEGKTDPEPEASQEEADRGPETPQTTLPDEAATTPTPDSGPGTSTSPEPNLPLPDDSTPG